MKVFLDDKRDTPDGWVMVYWPAEAIGLLITGNVEEISLDHDLGDADNALNEHRAEITGDDVIRWIAGKVILEGFVPPTIYIHSDNASAKQKMLIGIESIYRHWKANEVFAGIRRRMLDNT